ncbi:MAG: G5 domain-containing protein [Candidatus Saccharimonadales bacterium]
MHKEWRRINDKIRVEQRRTFRAPKFIKFIARHPFGAPIVLFFVLLGISVGTFLFITSRHQAAQPRVARIVILSYDHHEQTVPSNEETVGQLVKKLHIPIHEGDVIEPTSTTHINQDDFRINIYRAVPVKIVDAGKTTYTYSAATTSRSIAQQAGINLFPEDALSTAPVENFLKDYSIGEAVVVDRSTPVALNLYGAAIPTRTLGKTIKDMFVEKNIKIRKGDTVQPALSTPLTPNMAVAVIRNGIQTVNEAHDIAMPVQYINDANLSYGTTAVRQQGSPGKQVITYQINVQNGVEVSRVQLQSVVTAAPVTQIVVRGINLGGIKGDMALAGIDPGDYNYVDYIVSHESGWCPTKAQGQYGSCPAYAGYVPDTGGYGLCQSTPGSKMATAGSDWATNPVTQLKWCSGYAHSRYGSWGAAYNHWLSYHNW